MKLNNRRRLLAGLVFSGLAPMEALAQRHSNPGASSSSSSSSSSSAASTPPLPDCVLEKVALQTGVTLSSKVDTGNVVDGFVLSFTPAASLLRLTSLKRTDATSSITLQLTCQFSSTAPDGVEIAKLNLYLPEVTPLTSAAYASLSASTLTVGTTKLQKTIADGHYGFSLSYDDTSVTTAEFAALTAALRRPNAVIDFQGDAVGGGKLAMRYPLPRFSTLVAAAKPKLDKLKSDAVAGLCKIPDSDFNMAKFCTTATVEVLGLSRGCWELRALHDFRDWMRAAPRHAQEAEDYNLRAPGVVWAIAQRPDARRVWLAAYFTGVLPAAALAKAGCNGLARAVYRRMCLKLVRLAGL